MKQSTRVCASRLAFFLLASLVFAVGAAWFGPGAVSTVQAAGVPNIASDKPDYHPGETVTLTGSGFQPGEAVTVAMTVSPLTHGLVTLTSIADAAGNFTINSYLVQDSDLGVTFTAIATGDKGSVAGTTFTDSYSTGNITLHVGTVATGNAINVNPTGVFTGNTCAAATCTSSATVNSGTTLTFTAVAGTGFGFSSWTVTSTGTAETCASGTSVNPCVITSVPSGTNTLTITANYTTGTGPTITSTNAATFTVGTPGTFQVTASGSPSTFTYTETGTLPGGVSLSSAGVLGGTPTGNGGNFPITITANNGISPNGTQSFTLTVDAAPVITSAASTGFALNSAGTFTVTATGFPAPTFSETGPLPSGVTLSSAGVLSGTPTTSGSFPISIDATNGIGSDAIQNFTLTVGTAPSITSANTTTFTVGTAGSFTVTATGDPSTFTYSETGTLPGGVTLSSAGVLSGTPTGTGGNFTITITANNGIPPNATQSFTLTVDAAPLITSAASATFGENAAGTFTVVASGFPASTFTETGALPSGVTLSSAGVLSGTPAAGTSGVYPITITATNGIGTDATQNFTLSVGAQIAQRGTATTATGSGTSLTISTPAGVVLGDVMIVNIAQTGNNTTAPTSSGWTPIAGSSLGSPRYGAQLYRIATASEPSSYTFTLGTGVTVSAGAIVAFSGVNPTPNPFDVTPSTTLTTSGGSSTTVSAATTTTVRANDAVIMFGDAASTSPTWSNWKTATSPGTLAQLYSYPSTTVGATVGAAWATMTTAGSTGTGTATLSTAERNGGILMALRPAVDNPVPSITTLSPPSTNALSAAQTLTINGTNFVSNSTVTYNGVAHTATFVNAGQLTIQLTTGDQTTPGNYAVVVTNPVPAGGTSNSVNFVVNQIGTTTTVNSSVNPTVHGQPVTFTATVSPTPANGDIVTFFDGGVSIGTATTSSGVATLPATSALSTAAHSITATFPGDIVYATSSSAIFTQTVTKDGSTVALVSSASSGSVFGQSVTFTATVTAVAPGSGTAGSGETVTFMDGANTLGTGSTDSSGVATYTTTALSVATHSVTAVYNDDANLNSSTSTAVSQVVNMANTTVAVTTSGTPAIIGSPMAFTATVNVTSPGSGVPLAGDQVEFFDGANVLGTILTDGSTNQVTCTIGVAPCTATALSIGTHVIKALFFGDGNLNGSNLSPGLTQVITSAANTTLTSSPDPTIYGQPVTFTATVTPIPTTGDVVTFYDSNELYGYNYRGVWISGTSYAINDAVVDPATGLSYFAAVAIPSSIVNPATDVANTSGNWTLLVQTPMEQNGTWVSGTAYNVYDEVVDPNNSLPYVAINNIASDTVLPDADPTNWAPLKSIGTAPVNASGVATLTVSKLSVAKTHNISAVWPGDNISPASASPAVLQAVTVASATTTLTSGPNPTVWGQSTTFTATVTPVAPGTVPPSGDTVTFYDSGASNGINWLSTWNISTLYNPNDAVYESGTAYVALLANTGVDPAADVAGTGPYNWAVIPSIGTGLTNASGVATLPIASLSVATHNITAVYDPTLTVPANTDFTGSSYALVAQVVNKAAPSVALVPVPNPSVFGQSVTFTATVTAAAPGNGTAGAGEPVTFMDGANFLGTGTTNASGVATFTTNALSVATHLISAVYNDDANLTGGGSSLVSQVVNNASTTTTVSTSGTPSQFGDSVTFTATVATVLPGTGIPAANETVTFFDGATQIGTGLTSIIAGVPTATFATTTLSVASHSITAVYAGDGSFATSTSSAITQVVTKVDTTTTITTDLSTATVVGQPYTVAFTVAIAAGHTGTIPDTDTVTVTAGTQNCTAAVSVGSCQVAAATAGVKTVTATYAGDTNNATSTSAGVSHTVNAASTTTTVTSSAAPSVFGQAVTFTATIVAVAPGGGTPGSATNNVQFFDGVTSLGTATSNAGTGIATLTTSAFGLAVGTHNITAVYAANANYLSSTSAIFSQVVNQASTTTTVTTSLTPTVFGQSVTFTATIAPVAPGTGLPTTGETVTFFDGVTSLGTGTTNVSGKATLTTSALSVATHSITAVYPGDTNYLASTSAIFSQVVNVANTTTTVSAGTLGTATVVGQSYPVSYTVAITSPGAGTIPGTDSVTVTDGTATCTATVTAGTCTLTSLTAGTKSIKATYAGDTNFNTSTSSGVSHTVNKAGTTTAITNNLLNTTTIVGQAYAVNYSVTINSPGGGTIPGTDTVSVSDGAGGTCTGTITAGTCQLTSTTGGLLTVTASFVTDANYAASTSTGSLHDVTVASTTTTVTSSVNPSVFGQQTTLTATIAPVSPATGTPASATVTFIVDGSSVGTASSSSSTGLATFNTSMAVVGSPHSIIAVYGGTSGWGSSVSSAISQVVNQANSTTTLTSSTGTLVVHTSVTFTSTTTATTPGSGTAGSGETVTFMDFGTTLGTGTTNASGVATFTTSTLAFGPHSITAVYPGDTNLIGSTSTAFSAPVGSSGSATYTQPFNSGHGWTYTVFGTCTLSGSGAGCANSTNYTTAGGCATSPCVEASATTAFNNSTGGGQQGYFQNPAGTLTWASLGVPSGATVLTVQGSWWDNASTGCATSSTGPANTTAELEIVDTNGNWVMGTSTGVPLVPSVTVAGDTAATHTGSVLSVLSQYQASSTVVNLRLDLNPEARNATSTTCNLSADNLQLVITYVSAAGKRGQVIIGFNNTTDGPLSNMWLPKFEPTSN